MGDSVSASFASSFRKVCKPWQPASGGLICYAADVSPSSLQRRKSNGCNPISSSDGDCSI